MLMLIYVKITCQFQQANIKVWNKHVFINERSMKLIIIDSVKYILFLVTVLLLFLSFFLTRQFL